MTRSGAAEDLPVRGPQAPATPSAAGRPEPPESPACLVPVLDWLHAGVPITLLCDLAGPRRIPSRAIMEREGQPDDHWWRAVAHGQATAPLADGSQAAERI